MVKNSPNLLRYCSLVRDRYLPIEYRNLHRGQIRHLNGPTNWYGPKSSWFPLVRPRGLNASTTQTRLRDSGHSPSFLENRGSFPAGSWAELPAVSRQRKELPGVRPSV